MSDATPEYSVHNLSRIVGLLEGKDPSAAALPAVGSQTTKPSTKQLIHRLESLLFPFEHPWQDRVESSRTSSRVELLGVVIWDLTHQIHRVTPHSCPAAPTPCADLDRAFQLALDFAEQLPDVQNLLRLDAEAAYAGDPAARSPSEIIATYPGFYATMVYRLAHILFEFGVPLLPRLMTEIAHSQTGIDIHPGAAIGPSFFMDHGTGVVIGETTVIGARVTLYQGVTLGALNFPHDQNGQIIRGQKRHPTIGDEVVIYSGATILGGNTHIGAGSVIGGNVWLTESVPAHSRVTAQPKIELRAKLHK